MTKPTKNYPMPVSTALLLKSHVPAVQTFLRFLHNTELSVDLGFDCHQWGLMARAPDIETVFTLVITAHDLSECEQQAKQHETRKEFYCNAGWVCIDLVSDGRSYSEVPAERSYSGDSKDKARYSALPKYVNDIIDEWPFEVANNGKS